MPWFPFFCDFITCLGLLVLFCSKIQWPLSASTATLCSLTLPISLSRASNSFFKMRGNSPLKCLNAGLTLCYSYLRLHFLALLQFKGFSELNTLLCNKLLSCPSLSGHLFELHQYALSFFWWFSLCSILSHLITHLLKKTKQKNNQLLLGRAKL